MMDKIIIPPEALKDRETFRTWYIRVCQQLFPNRNSEEFVVKFKLTGEELEQVKLIEEIMRYANLIYHGDFSVIPYKNKRRKLNCKYSDILGIAIYVMKNYYDITVVRLGKLLNMNHSSITYHVLKHKKLIPFEPDHQKKYLKLITLLEYEKIIPITERDGVNPKWVLPHGLPK